MQPSRLSRRLFVQGGLAASSVLLLPDQVHASSADVDAAILERFGDRKIDVGRVAVTLPPISENGYSVALTIEVDSPMTDSDHVVRVGVFAEENPLPQIAEYQMGPQTGKARIETRVRLGGSQRVRAIAEMNDGSLWSGYDFSVVTLAACVL